MKFSVAIAFATVFGVVSARSVLYEPIDPERELAGHHEHHEDHGAVPPLKFTPCGSPSDTASVENIELSPNPPQFGKPLTVKVTGELKKNIEQGAKVDLHITSGIINLNKSFDICDAIRDNQDKLKGQEKLSCPIKADKKIWEQTVNLPNMNIPSIVKKVNIQARIKNRDGSQISCQNILWTLH